MQFQLIPNSGTKIPYHSGNGRSGYNVFVHFQLIMDGEDTGYDISFRVATDENGKVWAVSKSNRTSEYVDSRLDISDEWGGDVKPMSPFTRKLVDLVESNFDKFTTVARRSDRPNRAGAGANSTGNIAPTEIGAGDDLLV